MARQSFYQKHSFEIIGAVAVIAMLALYKDSVVQYFSTQAEIRQKASEVGKQANKLMLSEEAKNQLAGIANQRMRDGCLMVYSINPTETGGLQYTAFGEGTPIVKGEFADLYRNKKISPDANPNHFLPPGITVCAPEGPTGILEVDGSLGGIAVVRSYAIATDPEAIKIAVERSKKARMNVNKL